MAPVLPGPDVVGDVVGVVVVTVPLDVPGLAVTPSLDVLPPTLAPLVGAPVVVVTGIGIGGTSAAIAADRAALAAAIAASYADCAAATADSGTPIALS